MSSTSRQSSDASGQLQFIRNRTERSPSMRTVLPRVVVVFFLL